MKPRRAIKPTKIRDAEFGILDATSTPPKGIRLSERDSLLSWSEVFMRAEPVLVTCLLLAASAAFAATPMAPSDIQATFFNGQPFTASTPSGTQFKMTFTPDGKMTREPLAHTGYKNNGTWKLTAKGFCTTWQHAKTTCFTIIPNGENKWSVQQAATTIATTIAVWSK